jgi:hypothetical protein
MLLHVSSLGERPLEGSAVALAVSEATPVVLSLELRDEERLRLASLVVRRSTAVQVARPLVWCGWWPRGGKRGRSKP